MQELGLCLDFSLPSSFPEEPEGNSEGGAAKMAQHHSPARFAPHFSWVGLAGLKSGQTALQGFGTHCWLCFAAAGGRGVLQGPSGVKPSAVVLERWGGLSTLPFPEAKDGSKKQAGSCGHVLPCSCRSRSGSGQACGCQRDCLASPSFFFPLACFSFLQFLFMVSYFLTQNRQKKL